MSNLRWDSPWQLLCIRDGQPDGHCQAGAYEGSVTSSASSWSRYCRFPTCKMGITHLCFPLLHGMHGTWPPLWQTLLLLLRPAEAVTVVPWGGQRWH